MASITILGLGPGNPALLTREAWDTLSNASEVYLRTSRHPAVAAIPSTVRVHSFDDLRERIDDPSQIEETIAQAIVELGRRESGVIYAVPCHPLLNEAVTARILALAGETPVRIMPGLSFVEPALTALRLDGLSGLQIADATDVAAGHHPALDPDRPALLAHLGSRALAFDVKSTLLNQYPPGHAVKLLRADLGVVSLPLAEIDRGDDLSDSTTLYLPPLARPGGFESFQEVIAHLRAPEGCPWDREQTHASLRPYLLEETHEVLEAIDAGDAEALREELGDLLLQVTLQTQVAIDTGEFRMADVIAGIREKLIRRHPHVFGDVSVSGVEDVKRNWETIKQAEKSARESILDGLPAGLPALSRAEAYGTRAARVGFDWPDAPGVLEKVAEEVRELAEAPDAESRESEFGDVLFTLVNVARWLKIDPESALRAANARWARRFRRVEQAARDSGREMKDLSAETLNELWEVAKAQER